MEPNQTNQTPTNEPLARQEVAPPRRMTPADLQAVTARLLQAMARHQQGVTNDVLAITGAYEDMLGRTQQEAEQVVQATARQMAKLAKENAELKAENEGLKKKLEAAAALEVPAPAVPTPEAPAPEVPAEVPAETPAAEPKRRKKSAA